MADEFIHLETIMASKTFAAPRSTKFRFHVAGKGGNGSRGGDAGCRVSGKTNPSDFFGGGASGGSSGAYAIHEVTLSAGETVSVTVTSAETRIVIKGVNVYAKAGVDGLFGGSHINASSNSSQAGAAAPDVTGVLAGGGNVANYSGVAGGRGTDGNAGYNYLGGAGGEGGTTGTPTTCKYAGAGGAGGAGTSHTSGNSGSPAQNDALHLGGGAGGGSGASYYGASKGGQYFTGGDGGLGGAGGVVVEILANSPPTTPPSITYGTPDAGKPLALTCGTSTDPDGDTIQYVWESRVDSGVYTQNAVTGSTTASVTIPGSGAAWQARVKAVDSYGNESGYCTGSAKTINYNSPPTISGSDTNLGASSVPVSYNYTVNDIDAGQTLSVTERLDGVTLRTFSATRGQQYTVDTSASWLALSSGAHEITITVTDNAGGSATRTIKFSRVVERIAASRMFETDAFVEKCSISILPKEWSADSFLTLEVTNNPFDPNPVWEDVSDKANRSVHIFSNAAATRPGLGYRFTLTKGSKISSVERVTIKFA